MLFLKATSEYMAPNLLKQDRNGCRLCQPIIDTMIKDSGIEKIYYSELFIIDVLKAMCIFAEVEYNMQIDWVLTI